MSSATSAVGHAIDYRIHDAHRGNPTRRVEVAATPEEIEGLARDGYLYRPSLFAGEELARLRDAADRVEAAERDREGVNTSGAFGGLFARYLEDKDAAFLALAQHPALLSVARAVLGPAVRLAQVTMRVTYPGEPGQETCWHVHRRVIPEPMPAWFSVPHTLDALVYLDDADPETGPLLVVPGTHARVHEQPAADDVADKPGQVRLEVPAGGAVLMNSNVWHRGMPTTAQGRKRRLLIVTYFPAWFRDPALGTRPADGLTGPLREGDDEATRELFGVGGFV